MLVPPPRSTITDSLVPDTTRFRSGPAMCAMVPAPSARIAQCLRLDQGEGDVVAQLGGLDALRRQRLAAVEGGGCKPGHVGRVRQRGGIDIGQPPPEACLQRAVDGRKARTDSLPVVITGRQATHIRGAYAFR